MGPIGHGRRKRFIYVGVAVAALAIPATAVALVVGAPASVEHGTPPKSLSVLHVALVKRPIARTAATRFCGRLFTVKTSELKAKRVYAGTGRVSGHSLEALRAVERCQQSPSTESLMRRFDRRQASRHHDRVKAARAAIARAKAAASARAQAAAEAAAAAAQEADQARTVTASAASAGSPLPECTWLPESGGDPTAVNPTSGAGGYYQIMPSTWAAYGGTGLPQDAPLSEQTAIAEQIWATQGPSAWVNC
jgi:hypothetical protein